MSASMSADQKPADPCNMQYLKQKNTHCQLDGQSTNNIISIGTKRTSRSYQKSKLLYSFAPLYYARWRRLSTNNVDCVSYLQSRILEVILYSKKELKPKRACALNPYPKAHPLNKLQNLRARRSYFVLSTLKQSVIYENPVLILIKEHRKDELSHHLYISNQI